jgi:hypothetical protein
VGPFSFIGIHNLHTSLLISNNLNPHCI